MLSPRRIHELLDFNVGHAEVLSLYLELDPAGAPHAYKWLLQEALERESALRELRKDLDRVERFLSELKPGSLKGVAVFSAEAVGLWEAAPLPYTFKNLLAVDKRPYLDPLLAILEQHQRYGVVLLGPDSERVLEVHLGQIEERREDWGAARALGRRAAPAPEPPHGRLRALAARAARAAQARRWDRLIVGAPRELEGLFTGHLPIRLKHNLILDPGLKTGLADREVLERVLVNEREARKVRESVLVHRLVDGAGGDGPAVLGLERTLDALQSGVVRTLLVRDGLAKIGRMCGACGHLSLSDRKCASCGEATSQVFNLVAEMIQCAIDQDCEVIPILYDNRLDSLGRIGAELSHKPKSGRSPSPGDKPRPLKIPL